MIPTRDHERIREAESWMQEAFGTTNRHYMLKEDNEKVEVCLADALRVVENSGVARLIAEWRREEGVDPRGRKAYITEVSAMTLMLVQMRVDGDLRFNNMARTIRRLTATQRERLGIRTHVGLQSQWYDRLWNAVERLQKLVDPYPGNRRNKPTREQYARTLAAREPETAATKLERLFLLCNQLVEGSVMILPRELRRRFGGNTALDATKIPMGGQLGGPSKKKPKGEHLSINYDCGWWGRGGNHYGSNISSFQKRTWALEAEISVMVANAPGAPADFPLLSTAVSLHRPGVISGEGRRVINSLLARGYPIDHFIADRAYLPHAKPEDVQLPLAEIGARPVFVYDSDERGNQAQYENLILVGGVWYINLMPDELQRAHELYDVARKKAEEVKAKNVSRAEEMIRAAKDLLAKNLSERAAYKMVPKGKRRPNGSRQYMYPDPSGYTVVDDLTGEILTIDTATIVVPLITNTDADKKYEALKYEQVYPHDSEKWRAYYGLRSTVESQNAYIKSSYEERIADPKLRPSRGNTFAWLAVTFALVSANIRKIVTFIRGRLARVAVTTKTRDDESTYHSLDDLPRVPSASPPHPRA
jgi:hypothetical protein